MVTISADDHYENLLGRSAGEWVSQKKKREKNQKKRETERRNKTE